MCDPVTLLVVGTAVSGATAIKGAIDAKKDRKEAAKLAKENADGQRRDADIALRDDRADAYSARRAAAASSKPTSGFGGGAFSPRSFFQAS